MSVESEPKFVESEPKFVESEPKSVESEPKLSLWNRNRNIRHHHLEVFGSGPTALPGTTCASFSLGWGGGKP